MDCKLLYYFQLKEEAVQTVKHHLIKKMKY